MCAICFIGWPMKWMRLFIYAEWDDNIRTIALMSFSVIHRENNCLVGVLSVSLARSILSVGWLNGQITCRCSSLSVERMKWPYNLCECVCVLIILKSVVARWNGRKCSFFVVEWIKLSACEYVCSSVCRFCACVNRCAVHVLYSYASWFFFLLHSSALHSYAIHEKNKNA